jgi:DNA-3-methyladenine glycosylase II
VRSILTVASLAEGAGALRKIDGDFDRIIGRLGVPPLWGRRPGFATLIRIILEQQVSLVAARTLYRRIHRELGGMSAQIVSSVGESGLRSLGLTRQKARYCHGLATLITEGSLDLSAVAALPDHEGRSALLSVPGLGPWSVDIYYLMALRRPDVWPRGDLALATAIAELKGMAKPPSREEQETLSALWTPWRSVAARLLWAHYLAARGQYTPDNQPR